MHRFSLSHRDFRTMRKSNTLCARSGIRAPPDRDTPASKPPVCLSQFTVPIVFVVRADLCPQTSGQHISLHWRTVKAHLGGAREPTLHRIRVHQTGLLELKATVSEYGEVWNALDVIARGKFRELLCVYLEYDGSARKVARDLRNMGRRHPAWPAPGSPEIDEDRNFAVVHNFVELPRPDLNGLSRRR
jgi:hypothetical protein